MTFNRTDGAVPEGQVIGHEEQYFGSPGKNFILPVKSILVPGSRWRHAWSEQPRGRSMATSAMNRSGRVLFSPKPYLVRDFIGLLLGAFIGAGLLSQAEAGQKISWRRLDTGLELARVASPQRSYSGDSVITVVRVDPRHYRFQLVTARANGDEPRPVADWAARFGFAAAINAGLFARDYSTSIGLMVNFRRVNNPRLNGSKTVLAFNRKSRGVPRVQIIDRTCQNFRRLRRRYHTLIQSIRLIGCRRRVVWKQSDKRWSMAVIASDRRRRILMIHSRSPYSVHDLGRIIRRLPLGVTRAMYLEGGRAATLYVNAGGVRFQQVGTHGTRSVDPTATIARPVPNVIGIVRRGR